ncbi:MAG: proline racemase family protein [Alphaproteobacteria bacterium]|nr:proline racemase family protein [Alphaproteobacteria bacterium]
MSDSNAICATTALLETRKSRCTPQRQLSPWTPPPGKLVRAGFKCHDERCIRVTLSMPPAFAEELDVTLNTSQ